MSSRSLRELMDMTGRVALVTGGAGHLGGEAAAALAELGATVAVLDLDPAACEAAAVALGRDWGAPATAIPADLADAAAIRAVPERVRAALGRLDVLVNCAGLVGTSKLDGWVVPFAEQGLEAWNAAHGINVTAPFLMAQVCAPLLAESGAGAIVNVASIYGVVGPDLRLYQGTEMGNPAAYAASKGGLLQLTRWLATVLAPKVRVNAVTPGGVWRGQPETFVQRYVERTPLGRMAAEEDFKGAIGYLASGLSAYVTGQNLIVDGGWTAW